MNVILIWFCTAFVRAAFAVQLDFVSLTGLSALWKKTNRKLRCART